MAKRSSNAEKTARRAPVRRRSTTRAEEPVAQASERVQTVASEAVAEPSAEFTPPPEEVQRRAYELYVARGGDHGRDIDDWLEAERQLRDSRNH